MDLRTRVAVTVGVTVTFNELKGAAQRQGNHKNEAKVNAAQFVAAKHGRYSILQIPKPIPPSKLNQVSMWDFIISGDSGIAYSLIFDRLKLPRAWRLGLSLSKVSVKSRPPRATPQYARPNPAPQGPLRYAHRARGRRSTQAQAA